MLTMENIVRDGHPMLRKVVDEVAIPLSAEDIDLMKQMKEYLINSQNEKIAKKYGLREGVGIAAPQLGLNKRIFAVHTEDEFGKLHSYVLANPKVLSHSETLSYLPTGEGCLSVDEEIEGIVPRYERISLTAYTMDNEVITLRLKGFISIVFQHEIDHLNGKMFYDYINRQFPKMPPANAKPVEFE